MLGTLNDVEIFDLLTTGFTGRIGYNDGEKIYITPVTYVYNGTYIFGQTNEGRKLEYMRKSRVVCFEVDQVTSISNWKSVITWAHFEELSGTSAEEARELYYNSLLSLLTVARMNDSPGVVQAKGDEDRIKSVMFRLKITEQSGHFERR